MKISRAWSMPNSETFEVEPIARFVGNYIGKGRWVDPFARNSRFSRFCQFTNDLLPDANTTHHMEALSFLEQFEEGAFDGVLFDPPYSPRQITECYSQVGLKAHIEDTQSSFYSKRKDAAARLIKPGGVALSFGWNSNGFGVGRGFEIVEILTVAHGGAHNDTICMAERRRLDMVHIMEGAA